MTVGLVQSLFNVLCYDIYFVKYKNPRFESMTGVSSRSFSRHRLSLFCRIIFGAGSMLMAS
jgi:hypothetical protein